MTLQTSKRILKIFGVLGIISGIFSIIVGLVTFVSGGILAGVSSEVDEELAGVLGVTAIAGLLVLVIVGVVTLIEGIFSVQAAKNPKKATPAWVFAIIGLIGAVLGVVTNLKGGLSGLGGPICTLIINCAIFTAAKTVKQAGEEM